MRFKRQSVLSVVLLVASAGAAQAQPGDIIVGDSNDASVWRLKPKPVYKHLISDDKRLVNPNDSVFGRNGKIYVADYGAFAGNGAVFLINLKKSKTRSSARILCSGSPTASPWRRMAISSSRRSRPMTQCCFGSSCRAGTRASSPTTPLLAGSPGWRR